MLKLTQLRLQKGLSKAALARSANIDQTLVSKIESGRLRPYERELMRLATALDVAASDAASLLKRVAKAKGASHES